MFVCLTSLEELWDKSKKLLFIGSWCIKKNTNLKGLTYEFITYPWNNNKKIKSDAAYIYKIYQKIIPILSNELNNIHNQKLSTRYWELLLGIWLFKFI